MASRRNLVTGIVLGLSACAAVALGVTHWVTLPADAATLDRERARLETRIGNLGSHLDSWRDSPDGDLDRAELPAASALPAHAGDLLADMTAHGAVEMVFAVGEEGGDLGTGRRELRAEFSADVRSLATILDRLTLWRPAVTITRLNLATGDAGRIQVSMQLQLLGRGDA
ncbi:MAG: hypothetical protein HZA24_11615 [Nitrospirae bacterium]|nr:hypothetical protein [Nitrospirota bacterium]